MFASTNSIVPDTTGSGVIEESEKTRATYTSILSEFRHLPRAEGLGLDAADLRQGRALPALRTRIPDAAQQLKEQHPSWLGDAGDQAQVEKVVAQHTAALALGARAYVSRPALMPYHGAAGRGNDRQSAPRRRNALRPQ